MNESGRCMNLVYTEHKINVTEQNAGYNTMILFLILSRFAKPLLNCYVFSKNMTQRLFYSSNNHIIMYIKISYCVIYDVLFSEREIIFPKEDILIPGDEQSLV